jgi:AcrR family transcriptional regulator
MTAAIAHPHVQPPLQDRSRRTLEQIGRAVEELLATRSFDDISVADIVRQARCSVGSFYARFTGKDDLLPYLYQRYDADLRPRMQARMSSIDWERLSLRETVVLIVEGMIDMYLERRHLLRAVALLARTRPDEVSAEMRASRTGTTDMPAKLLARFADDIAHPDPLQAARVGFFMTAAIAREKILFGEAPHAGSTALTNDRLKRELARMLYGYLTTPDF